MEYQKVKDFLDNTPNQPPKFRTKKWVEINDDLRLTYNINIQLKFNTSMLRSTLCNYSDTYILPEGTSTITGRPKNATSAKRRLDERKKGVILKNCAPFTDCLSEINNTQVDNAKDVVVVMSMYNLIEHSDY